MKLVTWNCAGALQKKCREFLNLGADIMVIQECSQASTEQIARSEALSSHWLGANPNRGLAVLVRAPRIIREARPLRLKWAAKLVIGGPTSIELFPVWAHKDQKNAVEYVEQVHLLLDIIEQTALSPFTIVVGDFNSNSIWDRDYGIKNHSSTVDRFRKLGLESAYHVFFGEPQGAEQHKTHWNMKDKDRPYHIDYIFLSRPLLPKLRGVVVGSCDDWLSRSDHSPVLVELDV